MNRASHRYCTVGTICTVCTVRTVGNSTIHCTVGASREDSLLISASAGAATVELLE